MSENKNNGSEIDLLGLFSIFWGGIIKFFRSILDTFLFLFVFGIKHIHWLIGIVLIGALTGYLMYKTSNRVYSSELIAQPNGFSSIDMATYINDIHRMCENSNYTGIADAFDIPEEDAKQIKDIIAVHFIDINGDNIADHVDYKQKYDPSDTTTSIILNRILIQAKVLDSDKFSEIKEGLLKYIEKNPYLVTVNNLRRKELETLIAQTNAEIDKLDSLQNVEYYRNTEDEALSREGQIIFMNERVTQLYYRDKVSLLNARLNHEKDLELATSPITIIKDFALLEVEDNPLSGYIIKFGFLFGVVGYIGLLFIKFRKRIVGYLSTKG